MSDTNKLHHFYHIYADGQWQEPAHCYTDGAQGLIRTTLIDGLRFGCFTTDPVADCNFLLNCWDKSNKNLILDEIISNYNFLR